MGADPAGPEHPDLPDPQRDRAGAADPAFPADPAGAADPEHRDAPDPQRDRAEDVIRRIAGGADAGAEAFRFSNSVTDDWSARAWAAVRRWFPRRR